MDFKYLVETKNEFNNFLCSILVPHLYHGIKGMFKYSENVCLQIEKRNQKGVKINNPGIVNIFKKTLEGISSLNNHEIDEEYIRIKNSSGCTEWFDNLVKATFKSYALFLTWDPQTSNSKYAENDIYNNIIIKDFIHKCYIISCNCFKENPELFINKNNKKDIFETIKICIDMAIKKSLPYNQIIEEYLKIEFNKSNDVNTKEIANIKNLVYKIIDKQKYGIRPKVNNLIVEDTDKNEDFINIEDYNIKKNQLENFINIEKINQNKNESINNQKSFINLVDNQENFSKINTNGNELNISNYNTTSAILSRAEIKNKEINNIMNNKIVEKSELLEESETYESSESSETSNISENLQIIESNETSNITSNIQSLPSSKINIITTPPAIRLKSNDRLNDVLSNNIFKKRNVKVVKNNNNILSDKFEKIESYFDSMIKV